ncbi:MULTISPECIES: hypothetical protein [unclassified Nocardia]|uniref:hypothetical protein n=1 Tax=unclassified Nocardia TaxID=2637762 RepID=UPI001CE3E835|nr:MULTISPECIES: hypothetical protein [unclassified Nocardia]
MTTRKQATLARQQAHRRLAIQRRQRFEREQANEADLTAYLLLQQQLDDTERAFRSTVDSIRHRQAAHLLGWRNRGEELSVIAGMTGLSRAELGKLIKLASGSREHSPATDRHQAVIANGAVSQFTIPMVEGSITDREQ